LKIRKQIAERHAQRRKHVFRVASGLTVNQCATACAFVYAQAWFVAIVRWAFCDPVVATAFCFKPIKENFIVRI
jgi:hypothetical protein